MIDVSIINDEIEALEAEDTNYETCEKLACLYTVRRELKQQEAEKRALESSDFLAASVGAPITDLMKVLDEHMEAIKALYPAEYEAVVSKIKSLHE